ncbi:MAG: carbonic anhydrase [Panacagrimonas sp.]
MDEPQSLLKNNMAWAARCVAGDPQFFKQNKDKQKPDFLWIGCSDSRVPPNQVVDLPPGEIFVHRNVANVVAHADVNCQAVLHFAVEHIKVKHVLVVGHYGCGGVHASLDRSRCSGITDYWLGHVRDVVSLHRHLLDAEPNEPQRESLLVELNVMEQALNVCSSAPVVEAWARGQPLTVHGWVYRLADGLIRQLDLTVSGPCDLEELRRRSVESILAERARS